MKNKGLIILVTVVPLILYMAACGQEEVLEPSHTPFADELKPFDSESKAELIAFIRRNPEDTMSRIHVMKSDGTGVQLLGNGGIHVDKQPIWSADGRSLAYLGDPAFTNESRIYIMNMDGVINKPMDICSPHSLTWSPDGTRFAFESQHESFEHQGHGYTGFRIYTTRIHSPVITRLSEKIDTVFFLDMSPSWSPNGQKIAFSSLRPGAEWVWNHNWSMDVSWEIYVMNADGSGVARLTDFSVPVSKRNPAWSRDGKKIAFDGWGNGNSSWSIYVMNADGSNLFQVTDNLSQQEHFPSWSPDGTRLAFVSDHDGNKEIYVINVDGTGLKRLTNNPSDDMYPAWSPGVTGE